MYPNKKKIDKFFGCIVYKFGELDVVRKFADIEQIFTDSMWSNRVKFGKLVRVLR
jgi:hypothetical protein